MGKTQTKIDTIVTHKVWGFVIFFGVIFLMFQATFYLGKFPMDWIEAGVEKISELVAGTMDSGMLKDLIIDGIISGVGGVLVFLPNIMILFLFISLMESTGYMARAAYLMDGIMHKVGLQGGSFIPLIMGFGCNVPAILATKAIKNRSSRIITILINPLMSCSARLPVYLLLVSAFFPKSAGLILFGIYLTGILLAGVMAKVFRKTLFATEKAAPTEKLPPYKIPALKNIISGTWEKGAQYLKKIATIILAGSIIIWMLNYFPSRDHSFLYIFGQLIEPLIAPLGFDWKIGVALLTGIPAKEVIVSSLGVLNALTTITPASAISLMLFTLIYSPCFATLVAIKSETGKWKWALFTAAYTIVLAWIVAFVAFHLFSLFL
ncbi:MAG: ferrous iron transport protein B [Bacteroidales bacterium]